MKPLLSEIVPKLQSLQPLPKKHYSYALYPQVILDPLKEAFIKEIGRLNGSLSTHIDYTVTDAIDKIISFSPKEIALSTSPWSVALVGTDPTRWDKEVSYEILRQENNLIRTKTDIDNSNKKYGKNIPVTVVLVDQETYVSNLDQAWNNSINEKNNITYKLIKKYFPDCKIVQYNRGAGPYYPGGLGDYLNPSLYMPNEFRTDLDAFNSIGTSNNIIPNIALGGFIKRTTMGAAWPWVWDRYRYVYSYMLGMMVNNPWCWDVSRVDKYAHFERSPFVCFWPVCLDPNSTDWPWHYLSYILGAQPNPKSEAWIDE